MVEMFIMLNVVMVSQESDFSNCTFQICAVSWLSVMPQKAILKTNKLMYVSFWALCSGFIHTCFGGCWGWLTTIQHVERCDRWASPIETSLVSEDSLLTLLVVSLRTHCSQGSSIYSPDNVRKYRIPPDCEPPGAETTYHSTLWSWNHHFQGLEGVK